MEKRLPFRELFGDNKWTGDDSEGFMAAEDYKTTCYRLSLISNNEVDIAFESGDDLDYTIKLNLRINNLPINIQLKGGSDWFDESLIHQINSFIESNNFSSKRYFFIELWGVENMDQCFKVAFITNELFSKLEYYGYSANSDRNRWENQEIDEFDSLDDIAVY